MNNTIKTDNHYIDFLAEIKKRIRHSQYEALRAVNKNLINLYRDIVGMIV